MKKSRFKNGAFSIEINLILIQKPNIYVFELQMTHQESFTPDEIEKLIWPESEEEERSEK